jgi:hypothetical protein
MTNLQSCHRALVAVAFGEPGAWSSGMARNGQVPEIPDARRGVQRDKTRVHVHRREGGRGESGTTVAIRVSGTPYLKRSRESVKFS